MLHVEELGKRVERRHDERQRIKIREEEHCDHLRAITDALDNYVSSFWCAKCKKDFDAQARKRIGMAGVWPVAWYVARCKCGTQAIRRITDKRKDPYYRNSYLIKYSRVKDYNDMLHPHDPMFKLVYPKKWEQLEKGRQENEK